jgi:hypothetical protein
MERKGLVKLKTFLVKRIDLYIFFGLAIFFLVDILLSEKTDIKGGFGWDGSIYGSWVRDFPNILFKKLDSYYIVRVFPSFCVNILMRIFMGLFKIKLTDNNIILCWQLYNFIMILISILLSIRISNLLNFNTKAKLFVISLLFINLYMLKIYIWNPVLTDITALSLTLSLFYSYLKHKYWLLFLISVIGFFTWPTFIFLCAILFIFPVSINENITKKFYKFLNNDILYVIIGILFIVIMIYLFIHYFFYYNLDYDNPESHYASPMKSLVILSLLFVLAYLIYAYIFMISKTKLFTLLYYYLDYKFWIRISITIIMLFGLFLLKRYMKSGIKNIHDLDFYLAVTFNLSLIRPLNNLVSHLIWFGPVFLLILYYIKDIINKMISNGNVGIIILMFMGTIMSINPESRVLLTFIPILCFYLVLVLKEQISSKQIIVIVISQLIFSKIWYKFNWGDAQHWSNPLKFPEQHYFMNAGPWTSHQMFLINCVVSIIFIFIFNQFKIFKKKCNFYL